MSQRRDVSASALLGLAWEQGSLFAEDVTLPALAWAHETTQAHGVARRRVEDESRRGAVTAPVAFERSPKQGDRTIVITQTCDIIKSADDVPLVDVARVFSTANAQVIAEASNFGSARYYRLTPPEQSPALVLDFTWRALIDKGFLVEHDPDNSIIDGWTRPQRETFARWLGRRYSRPVLSETDVQTISNPLRDRWGTFVEEEPELARRCSENYAEFRFRRDDDGTLRVLILSPLNDPDESLGLEIAAIVREALEPHHPSVVADPGNYRTFTVDEYLTSEQIDLEWASHEEGEPTGAVPGE
jgi:hypothetical protein